MGGFTFLDQVLNTIGKSDFVALGFKIFIDWNKYFAGKGVTNKNNL
jgi:hypothetical protein